MITYLIIFFFLYRTCAAEISYRITINASERTYPLNKFWTSTGFSPPQSEGTSVKEYLLSKDVKINLAIISSLPSSGIQFIRIHWLLSLLSESGDGSINWKDLDDVIDTVVQSGLKPIIEFMGNSSLLQRGCADIRNFWKNLISSLISRYLDRYGKREILQWKFETWNEPDLDIYNVLKFSLDEYLEYVEGCIEGVKSVLARAEIGGPAGVFKDISRHPLCWGFLTHCNNSESRCNINYISLHKKGNGTCSGVLNGTLHIINTLKKYYNNLSVLRIVNDESDVLTGWWREEAWRGDVRYAAAVLRTVSLFKDHTKEHNIERISFDNGFINQPSTFFDQRTLLTRFTTESGDITFVQKPVYATMGLLGILGGEELPLKVNTDERFSIIATCSKNKWKNETLNINVLIGSSYDDLRLNSSKLKLKTKFILPEVWRNNAKYVLYMLDNDLPHPKQVWEDSGRPVNPNKKLLVKLQNSQGPHRILQGIVRKEILKIKLTLGQPSITFLQICSKNIETLGKVTKLKAFNMSYNEVLLTWNDPPVNAWCIKTYTIEHSETSQGIFQRINEMDIIFNSYNFIYLDYAGQKPEAEQREYTLGFYRVAVIDFWGRIGKYSDKLKYGL